ncbi:MAG: hypothetical protein QOI04_1304 [Verrucomicrobiota bacterium]
MVSSGAPAEGTRTARAIVGCGVLLGVGAAEGCGFALFCAGSSDFFSVFLAPFFFFGVALASAVFFFFGVAEGVSSSSEAFGFFFATGVSLGLGDALGFFLALEDFFGLVDFVGEGEGEFSAASSC